MPGFVKKLPRRARETGGRRRCSPYVGSRLGILRFGDWIGHDGAIFGFSTAMFYERDSGAQIVAAANLSSNFSTPTLEIFGLLAQHLYPASLAPD